MLSVLSFIVRSRVRELAKAPLNSFVSARETRLRQSRHLRSGLYCSANAITALVFCLTVLAVSGLPAQVSSEGGQEVGIGVVPLPRSMNPRVRRENDQGYIGSDKALSCMTMLLRRTPEQRAALDRLLEEQQNPSSPNYRRWLTPEEFGERFGVNRSQLDRIAYWLRARGFTVDETARGRGWVTFSGTAGQVEQAFRTEIHRYQVDGRMRFAPSKNPVVPTDIEQLVESIRGLDDFRPERRPVLRPMYNLSDGSHALAPGDAANIYRFSLVNATGVRGQGQKIVVVGQSAVDLADVQKFRSTFSLADKVPAVVLVGDDPGFDRDGAMQEANIDIEWAGVAAPNAQIVYVYAKDVLDATKAAIDQNMAPVLSFSFGTCEAAASSGEAAWLRDLAQQANAQGTTWVAASGDAGAAACDQGLSRAERGLAVNLPASLPEVTGVGGTLFNEGSHSYDYWEPAGVTLPGYASAVNYIPEVAWNESSPTKGLLASGGGASALYSRPAWQTGLGVPANASRNVPDVSFSAAVNHVPYLVVSGGLVYAFGGTSVAAPLFAGVLALLNQTLATSDSVSSGLGNINPALYALARQTGLTAQPFHDITSGDNIVPCSAGTPDCDGGSLGFLAGPGYDQVTGLGSLDTFAFLSAFRLPTATTLSLSAAQAMEGGQVVLTAKTRAADPNTAASRAPLSGFVAFELETKAYSSNIAVDSSGVATTTMTVPLTGWTPGAHSITAKYGGDGVFGESASAPVPITILPQPPSTPALDSPANQATGVPVGVALSYGSYKATSFDVYFGVTNPPPLWGKDVTATPIPSGLAPNTKYYWKVVGKNVTGAAESPVWSFTTAAAQQSYMISTLAGTGEWGNSGDGGPARQAQLASPPDVAADSAGNVFFTDPFYGRVRVVAPSGVVSTYFAGSSLASDAGGDRLVPRGIAVDSRGNVYISSDNRVHKIAPDGSISVVAGSASAGSDGDGGPAVDARLSYPQGLAVDSADNLYIADSANNCIRKIAGSTISTVAGKCGTPRHGPVGEGGPATAASVDWPSGVAVDSKGNLFIADTGHALVRKVSNGTIATVAGEGASGPSLGNPQSSGSIVQGPVRIAVDVSGNVFFTNSDGIFAEYVYMVSGGVVTRLAGGGAESFADGQPATTARLVGVGGLALGTGGRVFVADRGRNRIYTLSPADVFSLPSISPDGILNAASLTAAVAPGSIVAIFGDFGLYGPSQASGVPLPATLSGLSIQLQSGGGAPLYYVSSGQVNIQIPWELSGQSTVRVWAVRNGSGGPIQTLKVAPFAPAIFTTNGQGTGQGVVTDSSYRLVDSSNPVKPGDVVQVFCTGLGAVTNQPASGSPAADTALSRTTSNPTVRIGTADGAVLFSGLAPGTVGEYQVNVQVPAGAPSGGAIPVVVSIGGTASNTATIAIK